MGWRISLFCQILKILSRRAFSYDNQLHLTIEAVTCFQQNINAFALLEASHKQQPRTTPTETFPIGLHCGRGIGRIVGDKDPLRRQTERVVLLRSLAAVSDHCIKAVQVSSPHPCSCLSQRAPHGRRTERPADYRPAARLHPSKRDPVRKVTRVGFEDERIGIGYLQPPLDVILPEQVPPSRKQVSVFCVHPFRNVKLTRAANHFILPGFPRKHAKAAAAGFGQQIEKGNPVSRQHALLQRQAAVKSGGFGSFECPAIFRHQSIASRYPSTI